MSRLRYWLVLAAVLAVAVAGYSDGTSSTSGYAINKFTALTATGDTASFDVSAAVPAQHTMTAVVTGSPATCTMILQGSVDGGTTWFNMNPGDSCTSTNTVSVVNKPTLKVRVDVSLTGGTSPTVTAYYVGTR